MTIALSDNTPRISYTVSQGVTQTSFAVPFVFFTKSTDLNVFVDNVERTFDASTSNTTLYTVTGGDGSTGTVTTTVTGATGGSTVVITRAIPLSRTTDFPSSGAFEISKLNTELDTLTAIQSDFNDDASRALRLKESDEAVSMELPLKADRLGKVIGFNATTGAVEAGPTIADVSTLSAITADISTLADIEDGTDATDAIQTVSGISSNVTTVSGISANITTVAGISSNVTTVANDATDIGTVATNIASVNTVATNIADVVTVANDLNEAISEIETAANDLNEATSEIDTVANAISNVDTVGTNIANVNTVAGISSNVTTVAGISANVTTVAGVSSDVTTVAGISSNVTAVAGDATDIGTVATNISNVNTVAGIDSNVTTVAGISANVTTVAGISSAVSTVATNVSSINNFDARYRVASSDPTTSLDVGDLYFNTTENELKTYNGSAWQTTAVSPSLQTNINIVAGEITAQEDLGNITDAVATSTGNNIETVGDNITSVNTVAGVASNVTSVANNISSVNSVAASVGGSVTYTVTVTNPGSGNVFVLDGDNNPTLTLTRGFTYIFDLSDSSVSGHPLAFKNGSTAYTDGVTTTGTAGQAGAKVTFVVPSDAPDTGLRYYCTYHGNSMGNTISTQQNDIAVVVANIDQVNGFAARYRVASTAPTTSLDEGDLYYNTTTNKLNFYNGSAFEAIVAGALTDVVDDTTPQLGGNLDVNGNSIVSVSNGDITIAPNGSGEINLNGTVNTDNLTMDFGSIA